MRVKGGGPHRGSNLQPFNSRSLRIVSLLADYVAGKSSSSWIKVCMH